jgi:hypothetical protein
MLGPIQEAHRKPAHEEIVARMRALRKRVKPGTMSVRELMNEERRF